MANVVDAERLAFTPKEVAKLLGIGRDSAYRAVRDGSLPVAKVGGRLVVPAAALRHLMREAAAGAPAPAAADPGDVERLASGGDAPR